MDVKNLQFYGVSEMRESEEGLTLYRYPNEVVERLGRTVLGRIPTQTTCTVRVFVSG